MHKVPVVGETIAGGILGHWRHDDAVPKGDAADRPWAEVVDLRHIAIVIRPCAASMMANRDFEMHVANPTVAMD